MPVLIYSMMRLGITPTINALATSILIVSVTLVVIATALIQREGSREGRPIDGPIVGRDAD